MKKTRMLALSAMIAAIYAVLSLALFFVSFGAVQIRLAECLTLLPVLSVAGIYGVVAGCFLTNLIGAALGLTMPMDIFFGTVATAIAAVLTYKLRNVRIAGLALIPALPPVVVNGLVVGFELTLMAGNFSLGVFCGFAGGVMLGQLFPCMVLGVFLVWILEKKGLAQKFFSGSK